MAVLTACRIGMGAVLLEGLQPVEAYMEKLILKNHISLEWHGLWYRTLEDQKKTIEEFNLRNKWQITNEWLFENKLGYLMDSNQPIELQSKEFGEYHFWADWVHIGDLRLDEKTQMFPDHETTYLLKKQSDTGEWQNLKMLPKQYPFYAYVFPCENGSTLEVERVFYDEETMWDGWNVYWDGKRDAPFISCHGFNLRDKCFHQYYLFGHIRFDTLEYTEQNKDLSKKEQIAPEWKISPSWKTSEPWKVSAPHKISKQHEISKFRSNSSQHEYDSKYIDGNLQESAQKQLNSPIDLGFVRIHVSPEHCVKKQEASGYEQAAVTIKHDADLQYIRLDFLKGSLQKWNCDRLSDVRENEESGSFSKKEFKEVDTKEAFDLIVSHLRCYKEDWKKEFCWKLSQRADGTLWFGAPNPTNNRIFPEAIMALRVPLREWERSLHITDDEAERIFERVRNLTCKEDPTVDPLGQGYFGSVFDISEASKPMVVKIPRMSMRSLKHEWENLKKLQNTNDEYFVKAYLWGKSHNTEWIVFEKLDRVLNRAELDERSTKELLQKAILECAKQLDGLVQRDIFGHNTAKGKENEVGQINNVMWSADKKLKLIDFGCLTRLEDARKQLEQNLGIELNL